MKGGIFALNILYTTLSTYTLLNAAFRSNSIATVFTSLLKLLITSHEKKNFYEKYSLFHSNNILISYFISVNLLHILYEKNFE